MSEYRSPSTRKEFISRTNEIIRQYEKLQSNLADQYYDVTLILNCLLGLLVMPREAWLDKLTDVPIPDSIKNTLVKSVFIEGQIQQVKFKEYITGLRNGIVHFGKNDSLSFENMDDKISKIIIIGKTNKYKHVHTYEFSLLDSNQLLIVINEVFKFIEPCT